MEKCIVAGKRVCVYPAQRKDAPLVLLHEIKDEGEQVYKLAIELSEKEFSLASIGNLDWDGDMSPWALPPLFKGNSPCTGKADEYLPQLTDCIVPKILQLLSAKPQYIALAGYSLAGLFAVYSLYKTTMFSRIASASGSFWYPNFLPYAENNDLKIKPQCMYFSLGDREARGRNKILRTVEANTRALHDWYEEQGINITLEMNEGTHFQNTELRMAKGIAWMINPY